MSAGNSSSTPWNYIKTSDSEVVMKKRVYCLILICMLLFPALAGCGIGRTADSEPDYSWFVFPEETGELVIYTDDEQFAAVMEPALQLFKELSPDSEVTYQTVGEDEYKTMLREDIPAGRGPDLVLFKSNTFPDIYKIMSEDLFIDLNPYFFMDEDIDLEDFIGTVMDGGVLNGKRYAAPINYEMPLLLTTRSILKDLDMKKSDLDSSCESFFDAAVRFHEQYPDGDLFIDQCGGYSPDQLYIRSLYLSLGFNFIDYRTDKVTIDEDLFHQFIDIVKLYYNPDYDITDLSKESLDNGFYYNGGALRVKKCLFDTFNRSYSQYNQATGYLDRRGVMTALTAQRNQDGGVTAEISLCAAIPSASANKAAAWTLLKILLSDEIQGGHDASRYNLPYFWTGYPVRRDSIRSFLHSDNGTETDALFIPESLISQEEYIEMVQSPTEARMIPNVYRQLMEEEIMPYIRGEKAWKQCYKSLVKALKSYMKS